MGRLTNEDVASVVGCSASMVSRIRSGKRRPSAVLRDTITIRFELDPAKVIEAYGSPDRFAQFIEDEVFTRSRESVLTGGDPSKGENDDSQHEREVCVGSAGGTE
jgi:transcriptional regulator with XRE-family HTH domain